MTGITSAAVRGEDPPPVGRAKPFSRRPPRRMAEEMP